MDTIGNQNFVYNSKVSLTRASGIFLVGVVCVMAQCGCVFRAFLCCTLAGDATQRLVLLVKALI